MKNPKKDFIRHNKKIIPEITDKEIQCIFSIALRFIKSTKQLKSYLLCAKQ